jgi:asparaginyl-tRNA synthetase
MLGKLIREILVEAPASQDVEIRGWVRTRREMKNLVFVEMNDGSCLSGIQCTFDRGEGTFPAETEKALADLNTGTAAIIKGRLVPSPASGQAVEVAANAIVILGEAPADNHDDCPAYPLQKKRHSMEFLREIAHLRPRTNTFGAVLRLRSRMAFAIHEYFTEHGFQYIHTPIITAGDAEGAGAMFQVTTLDPEALAKAGNAQAGSAVIN